MTKHGEKQWIPSKNMYFLNVDDFDLTVELIKSGKATLSSILEKAAQDDMDFQSKKFVFRQHLQANIVDLEFPQYIHDEYEWFLREFERKILGQ